VWAGIDAAAAGQRLEPQQAATTRDDRLSHPPEIQLVLPKVGCGDIGKHRQPTATTRAAVKNPVKKHGCNPAVSRASPSDPSTEDCR
jgi:hypothetical protein